jgi:mercuric ion transport protein
VSEVNLIDHGRVSWLALFASTGTLICCALPILLVALGFGSVVAAITSYFPVLVVLSENEGWMFGLSAILLGLTAWLLWGRQMHCPSTNTGRRCCND